MSSIELKDISKTYGPRQVLEHVSLCVEEGEFVSIVGTSSSGKTTLLKIASGLEKPSAGSISIAGQGVEGFPRGASIVFQNYSLLPWLSAIENVRLAVENAFPEWPRAKQKDQSAQYLQMVGLSGALSKRPSQLSGGMRQRVAIARAFAVEPRILFLDEPFGALDALTRGTLQQELARLCDAQNPRATVLMITNSVDEAILLSDRILALRRDLSRGGSSLTAAAPVMLPRPRAADLLLHDEEAVRVRARVTDLLTSGRNEQLAHARSGQSAVRRAVPVEA